MKLEAITHDGRKWESPDLKPCPFCGSHPIVTFKGNDFTDNRSAKIQCGNCNVSKEVGAITNSLEWCADTLCEWWNERHRPSTTFFGYFELKE